MARYEDTSLAELKYKNQTEEDLHKSSVISRSEKTVGTWNGVSNTPVQPLGQDDPH